MHSQSKGQSRAKRPAAIQFKHLPTFKTVFLLSSLDNTLNLSQLAKKCLEEESLHIKPKGIGLEPRDLQYISPRCILLVSCREAVLLLGPPLCFEVNWRIITGPRPWHNSTMKFKKVLRVFRRHHT